MLLSTVSVLVVAQSSSEVPEGLMNNPVFRYFIIYFLRHNFHLFNSSKNISWCFKY